MPRTPLEEYREKQYVEGASSAAHTRNEAHIASQEAFAQIRDKSASQIASLYVMRDLERGGAFNWGKLFWGDTPPIVKAIYNEVKQLNAFGGEDLKHEVKKRLENYLHTVFDRNPSTNIDTLILILRSDFQLGKSVPEHFGVITNMLMASNGSVDDKIRTARDVLENVKIRGLNNVYEIMAVVYYGLPASHVRGAPCFSNPLAAEAAMRGLDEIGKEATYHSYELKYKLLDTIKALDTADKVDAVAKYGLEPNSVKRAACFRDMAVSAVALQCISMAHRNGGTANAIELFNEIQNLHEERQIFAQSVIHILDKDGAFDWSPVKFGSTPHIVQSVYRDVQMTNAETGKGRRGHVMPHKLMAPYVKKSDVKEKLRQYLVDTMDPARLPAATAENIAKTLKRAQDRKMTREQIIAHITAAYAGARPRLRRDSGHDRGL